MVPTRVSADCRVSVVFCSDCFNQFALYGREWPGDFVSQRLLAGRVSKNYRIYADLDRLSEHDCLCNIADLAFRDRNHDGQLRTVTQKICRAHGDYNLSDDSHVFFRGNDSYLSVDGQAGAGGKPSCRCTAGSGKCV